MTFDLVEGHSKPNKKVGCRIYSKASGITISGNALDIKTSMSIINSKFVFWHYIIKVFLEKKSLLTVCISEECKVHGAKNLDLHTMMHSAE